jgi:FtsZ-binding cell division protein ZapB
VKLKLEVFTDCLILSVHGEVSPRAVEVLNAGFSKLHERKVKWIFVDLSSAALSPEASQLAASTEKSREPSIANGVQKVFYVGKISGLCEFSSLAKALEICPAPEARALGERVKLETELAELEDRRSKLDAEASRKKTIRRGRHALETENRQLKRVREAMEKELALLEKAGNAIPSVANADLVQQLDAVRNEIRAALKEAGLA